MYNSCKRFDEIYIVVKRKLYMNFLTKLHGSKKNGGMIQILLATLHLFWDTWQMHGMNYEHLTLIQGVPPIIVPYWAMSTIFVGHPLVEKIFI